MNYLFCIFSGENIAAHLTETMSVWNVKDPIFVTDNAANEKKAISLIGCPRVGCYGHRLNLVVKNGLQIAQAKYFIEKGRAIVTFFNTSTTATEILLKTQEGKPLHLVKDVMTRWNSSLDMIARLDKLFPVLTKIILDGSLKKRTKELQEKMYSLDDRDNIKALINVLEPFKCATEMLSSDTYPTQGLILPAMRKLEQVLIVNESDSEMIKEMKCVMKQQLVDRTQDKDIGLVACKLTPSLRHMSFATEEEKAHSVQLLKEELLKVYHQHSIKSEKDDSNSSSNNETESTPPLPVLSSDDTGDIVFMDHNSNEITQTKKIKLECDKSVNNLNKDPTAWMDDIIFVSETKGISPVEQAEKELQSYLSEPPSTELPLKWWKENELKYPKLSVVAKKYLAIPASSVSSERVFSLTGNIINKKRSRLRSDNVDMMVFLNKNQCYC